MKQEEIESIKKLEQLAGEILEMRQRSRPRRPIVIEFCGSPKSGKSSCLSSLNIFLKRNNFKTQVLAERASVCPVLNKFDPLFNVWTSCSAIAELSEYLSYNPRDVDIILADRAIFDALCWFEWQKEHQHLDEENYRSLVTFLTMNKWRSTIDLIYAFTAIPRESLDREYATLLTRKVGSVMNPKILDQFNRSMKLTMDKYGGLFQKTLSLDTSDMQQNEVSFEATKKTLETLREMTVEQIGYLDVSALYNLRTNTFRFHEIGDSSGKLRYKDRVDVEQNDSHVQPVPVVIFTNQARDQFLVLRKKKETLSELSPEKEKLLVYAGGHVRREDNVRGDGEPLLSVCKTALSREITEELGVSYCPHDEDPLCIWVRTHPKSKKHLAICFIVEVDFEHFSFRLNDLEFVQRTGKTKSGTVMSKQGITAEKDEFDSWSRYILKEIFDVDLQRGQLELLEDDF